MRYDIEPKIYLCTNSKDYGKVFGFTVWDTRKNKRIRSYLLHEYRLASLWLPSRKRKAFIAKYESIIAKYESILDDPYALSRLGF
jgi:hypothetical protein